MSKVTIAKIILVINFLMIVVLGILFPRFGHFALVVFSVVVFVISVTWSIYTLEDSMRKW
jgi:hypothetical protein